MASKKLTDADKQEILQLYRQPEETTLTLASRYGVSNSTISRFLKSTLPKSEYESLIQQKRTARAQSGVSEEAEEIPMPSTKSAATTQEKSSESASPLRRKRKRPSTPAETPPQTQTGEQQSASSSAESTEPSEADEGRSDQQLDLLSSEEESHYNRADTGSAYESQEAEQQPESTQQWQETIAESFFGVGEDLDLDDEEDFEDFEDEDLDAETETSDSRQFSFSSSSRSPDDEIQILPLQAASFPKTCYLVVDRGSDLITRPLRDFSDLGKIPQPETDQIALPVFDNHRVARRFASRAQRVCKVPDAQLFQKVRPYLQAKGITRLLLNGQVYAI
jgi:transposase-like protein